MKLPFTTNVFKLDIVSGWKKCAGDMDGEIAKALADGLMLIKSVSSCRRWSVFLKWWKELARWGAVLGK